MESDGRPEMPYLFSHQWGFWSGGNSRDITRWMIQPWIHSRPPPSAHFSHCARLSPPHFLSWNTGFTPKRSLPENLHCHPCSGTSCLLRAGDTASWADSHHKLNEQLLSALRSRLSGGGGGYFVPYSCFPPKHDHSLQRIEILQCKAVVFPRITKFFFFFSLIVVI